MIATQQWQSETGGHILTTMLLFFDSIRVTLHYAKLEKDPYLT